MWVACHREFSVIVPSCVCGYFVGPTFFLVGASWIQHFFWRVFRGFKKIFFVVISWCKIFLVGVSWVQNFLLWVFCRSEVFQVFHGPIFFLTATFVIQKFLVIGWMRKSDRKQKKHKCISNRILYPKSISTTVVSGDIRKVLHLLN